MRRSAQRGRDLLFRVRSEGSRRKEARSGSGDTGSATARISDAADIHTVSTAYYFWMMLLFTIPVIGLIVCLVTAFSGEDASRKNFSRAALIWIVVGAVLAVVAVVALALLSNAAMPIIRSAFEGIM